MLNLIKPGKKFTIIQIFAPTKVADEDEVNILYDTIYEEMDKAYEDFIVMGNFNAKIGKPQKDENLTTNQYGYETRNESRNRPRCSRD